jgi:hypothetical protein
MKLIEKMLGNWASPENNFHPRAEILAQEISGGLFVRHQKGKKE